MHNDILTAIVALYLTMSVCWSVCVNLFRGVLNNFIPHSYNKIIVEKAWFRKVKYI